MAEAEAAKSLSGLLVGICQQLFYGNDELSEELLRSRLFPNLDRDHFTALHRRMRGLLKVRTCEPGLRRTGSSDTGPTEPANPGLAVNVMNK